MVDDRELQRPMASPLHCKDLRAEEAGRFATRLIESATRLFAIVFLHCLTDCQPQHALLRAEFPIQIRYRLFLAQFQSFSRRASRHGTLDTLGWVYFKLGQNDRALPLLQKATAARDSPTYQYHLGMALYRQGDTKAAKTHLQQAVDAKVNFAGIEEAKATLAKM